MWPYTRQENAWLSGTTDAPPALDTAAIGPATIEHYRAVAARMRSETRARLIGCAARAVWRLPLSILAWIRRLRRVSVRQSRPI